jgi:hypothetical protein
LSFTSFQKKERQKKSGALKKSDSSADIARGSTNWPRGGMLPPALRVRKRVPPPFAPLTHETNSPWCVIQRSNKTGYFKLPGAEIVPATEKAPMPLVSSRKSAPPASKPLPVAPSNRTSSGNSVTAGKRNSAGHIRRLEGHRQYEDITVDSSQRVSRSRAAVDQIDELMVCVSGAEGGVNVSRLTVASRRASDGMRRGSVDVKLAIVFILDVLSKFSSSGVHSAQQTATWVVSPTWRMPIHSRGCAPKSVVFQAIL